VREKRVCDFLTQTIFLKEVKGKKGERCVQGRTVTEGRKFRKEKGA